LRISAPDDDVVDDGHGLKTLDHLEGTPDAALAALGCRQARDILAVENDRALRGRQHTCDQVETASTCRRRSGRSGRRSRRADRDRDIAVGDEPAEALPDAAVSSSGVIARSPLRHENTLTSPFGSASEIATINAP